MTDLVNGTPFPVQLGNGMTLMGNGAVARGLDFSGVILTGPDNVPISLATVQRLLGEGRTWAAPRGGPAAFFHVAHAASGAPAVLYTTARAQGAMPGIFRHEGLGLQYFNPSPGATVPGGFQAVDMAARPSQQHQQQLLPHVFGSASTSMDVAGATPAVLGPHYDARLELTNPSAAYLPCQTVPIELYSLQRLFSNTRLAQAQGQAPPVLMYVPEDGPQPSEKKQLQIEFSAARAAARPAGFASLSGGCGTSTAYGPYDPYRANEVAHAAGIKLVAGPPRPQDLIPTQSAADEGSVRAMLTHPLATVARPLGFGQLQANLASVSDTEIARREATQRANYLVDRYADLRIMSTTL